MLWGQQKIVISQPDFTKVSDLQIMMKQQLRKKHLHYWETIWMLAKTDLKIMFVAFCYK